MKNQYTIIWTSHARSDLLEIAKYIAKDSVTIAMQKIELIEEAVKPLATFPEKGRNVSELEEYENNRYKELIVNPWRIIYSIDNKTVNILMVVDSRRNLQDILYKKLMNQ